MAVGTCGHIQVLQQKVKALLIAFGRKSGDAFQKGGFCGSFVEQERINSFGGWSKRFWATKVFQKVIAFRTEIGSALLKDLAVKKLMVVNQFHHIVPAASDVFQRGKKRVLVAQQDAVVLKIIQKMVHLSAFFQNLF